MPKQKKLTAEEQELEDFKSELQNHFAGTIASALMERGDVVAVTVPAALGLRAPKGSIIINMDDGSSVKARFTVDEFFAVG